MSTTESGDALVRRCPTCLSSRRQSRDDLCQDEFHDVAYGEPADDDKWLLDERLDGTSHEAIQVVFDRVRELVQAKDVDYGKAWQRRGWRSQLERVLLKADRLDTMLRLSGPQAVPDDKILETVHDMIALLAFMGLNVNATNEWGTG